MPPHAEKKSPLSNSFIAGIDGEWSDTTMSITPSASACQSRSWLAASRTGGQHLYWVWPSGTSSAVIAR